MEMVMSTTNRTYLLDTTSAAAVAADGTGTDFLFRRLINRRGNVALGGSLGGRLCGGWWGFSPAAPATPPPTGWGLIVLATSGLRLSRP